MLHFMKMFSRLGQISEKESLVGIFEEKVTNNFFRALFRADYEYIVCQSRF